MNIFIWRDSEEYGPFSRSEIFTCLLRGELSNDDLARSEVDRDWRPLRDVLRATVPASDSPDRVSMAEASAEPIETEVTFGLAEETMEAAGFDAAEAIEEPTIPAGTFQERPEMQGIFIRQNDAVLGPYSQEEIFAALFRKELTPEDCARREGDEEWSSLSEVLKARSGMLISPTDETSVIPEPVEIPEGTGGEALGLVTEILPKRSLFDLLGARTILAMGVIGMILAFGATYLVLKTRQKPDLTMRVQDASGNVATAKPSIVSTPASTVRYAQAESASPIPSAAETPQATPDIPVAATAASSAGPYSQVQKASTPPISIADKTPSKAVLKTEPKPMPSPPKTPVLVKVREIILPKVDEIDSSSFWTANTAEKPRAVLVLCLETGARPHDLAADRVWQTFAHDNQLALAAINFASDPKVLTGGGGYYRADHGAGSMLLTGLQQAFGQPLPIILYGREGGAVFATSFASWKPDHLLMWAAYTGTWLLQPQPEKKPVPALIACDRTAMKNGAPVTRFYSAGRTEGKPWTLLSLTGHPEECRQQMDEFFRQYLPAMLSMPSLVEKAGVWADVETGRPLTSLSVMVNPAKAAWLPSPEVQQKWADIVHETQATAAPVIIERDEATRNPKQPSMHMYLRLPPGAVDGRSVSGVLAYCTWQNEDAAVVNRLSADSHSNDMVSSLLKFAEDHNLAVLTWGTVDAWDNTKNSEELDRLRQEQFDKNFELLANAWARGVAGLGHDTGIPQKDFLLYGISRGAQWAHRLALHKPDYFLAVHVHIPSTFDKPVPEANKVLWLVTTGEQEYGYVRAQEFYHECCSLGYPIIFKAIIGIGHADSSIEHALGVKFFEYALSVKAARDAWEEAANDPLNKLRANAAIRGPWLETFRAPAYYGDFLNQECYPAQQANMIPVALRVPLPTKELADLWNK